MGKIEAPKRIRTEDFSSDQRAIVERIGEALNTFNQDVYNLLYRGLDFDNLNQQIITIPVTIDGSGDISNEPKFVTSVRGKIRGVIVVNCVDPNNPSNYPTSQPFVSFNFNNNVITVNHVTGLNPGSSYQLTLLILP